jgi:hypothetical protein
MTRVIGRIKAAAVLGVLMLAVGAVYAWTDQSPDDEPAFNWGPDEPNWADKTRTCTNMTFVIEVVVNRQAIPDRVKANVEATLGSAGSYGRSNTTLYDLYAHPTRRHRHEFCAKPGDWLHADVILMPGQPGVNDLSCSFYMGPDHDKDDATQDRGANDPPMLGTWCEGIAP